ncbi:MAG: c-type cytochrome [Bacteroidota bacterium]
MKNINIQKWMYLLLILILLTGCAGKKAASTAQAPASDSTHTDSLAITADQIPDKNLTYEQREGKHFFTKYCAVCHGDDGKGDGFNSFNLDPKPRDFTDSTLMSNLTDERIIQTITEGGRSVNRSILMPSWGGRLSKEEIRYVLSYVRLFHPVK